MKAFSLSEVNNKGADCLFVPCLENMGLVIRKPVFRVYRLVESAQLQRLARILKICM